MKKGFALIICMLQIFLLVGCGTIDKITKNISKEINDTASGKVDESLNVQDTAEEIELKKYNAYVDLNNLISDRMTTVENSYFDNVEYQEELVLKNDDFYCNSLSDSDRKILETAYEFVDKEPKFDAMDSSVKELYPVMKEIMEAFSEVNQYSEMKSYVDDNYAKGKILNKTIFNLYQQYYDLSENFMNDLDVEEKERTSKDMKQLKSDEMYISYYLLAVINRGNDLQDYIVKNNITSENLLNTDLTGFKQEYDLMVTDIQELNKYSKDTKLLEKEGYSSNPYQIEQYLSAAVEMKVSATEIIQRIQNQDPISSSDLNSSFFLQNTTGSIEKFNDKLSSVIDSYNSFH